VKIKFGLLKEHISLILNEEWNNNKPTLLSSEIPTNFGSPAHLTDLQKLLKHLVMLRNSQKRGSASRFAYSQTIQRLKSQIKKIEKKLEKR